METSAEPRSEITLDKIGDKPMVNNFVLVKVDVSPDDGYKLKSGIIMAGAKWNESARLARFGKVVKAPSRLIGRWEDDFASAMWWKTEVEVEEGDTVFFSKIGSANCPIIHVGEDTYYLMPYRDLIARKREGELYPLNGFAILEKVVETKKAQGIILDFSKHHNKRLGVVKYLGRKNDFYFGTDVQDADVQVGDKAIFDISVFTEIENELFATEDKNLGFVSRSWIIGVLSDDSICE